MSRIREALRRGITARALSLTCCKCSVPRMEHYSQGRPEKGARLITIVMQTLHSLPLGCRSPRKHSFGRILVPVCPPSLTSLVTVEERNTCLFPLSRARLNNLPLSSEGSLDVSPYLVAISTAVGDINYTSTIHSSTVPGKVEENTMKDGAAVG